MALELSEGSDDDADSVKTVSPAAVNHTLVTLMDKASVDEPDNSTENDSLNLPSPCRSRRNSRGCRDRDANRVTKMQIPASEHSNHFIKSSLQSVTSITHNTKLFTLELPAGSHMIIPMGYHIKIKASEDLIHSYTPVLPLTGHSVEGKSIDLLIKLYSDGRMSRYLSSLAVGDQVLISEPEGNFSQEQYEAADELVMLAAGTGFTPMMKLIRHHLSANPHKKCKLIFFNRTVNDIYYKQKLHELTTQHQNFSVIHVLSNADASWDGVRGRVNKELLQEHLPPYTASQRLFLCGHIEFTQAVINILMEMNYPDECVHAFT